MSCSLRIYCSYPLVSRRRGRRDMRLFRKRMVRNFSFLFFFFFFFQAPPVKNRRGAVSFAVSAVAGICTSSVSRSELALTQAGRVALWHQAVFVYHVSASREETMQADEEVSQFSMSAMLCVKPRDNPTQSTFATRHTATAVQ